MNMKCSAGALQQVMSLLGVSGNDKSPSRDLEQVGQLLKNVPLLYIYIISPMIFGLENGAR